MATRKAQPSASHGHQSKDRIVRRAKRGVDAAKEACASLREEGLPPFSGASGLRSPEGVHNGHKQEGDQERHAAGVAGRTGRGVRVADEICSPPTPPPVRPCGRRRVRTGHDPYTTKPQLTPSGPPHEQASNNLMSSARSPQAGVVDGVVEVPPTAWSAPRSAFTACYATNDARSLVWSFERPRYRARCLASTQRSSF